MCKFLQTSGSPKESASEFQYLAVAYLTELRPYVVVLGFGKTNTFVPLKL